MNKSDIEEKIRILQNERNNLNNNLGNINKEIKDYEGAVRELTKTKSKISDDLGNIISTIINRIEKNEKRYKFKSEYKNNVRNIILGSGSREALQNFDDGIKKAKKEIVSLENKKKNANARINNIDYEIKNLKRTLNTIIEEENVSE